MSKKNNKKYGDYSAIMLIKLIFFILFCPRPLPQIHFFETI
jgi:hypothetical protein